MQSDFMKQQDKSGAPSLESVTWETSNLYALFCQVLKTPGSILKPLLSFVIHLIIGTMGVILFSNFLISSLFMLAHAWNPSVTLRRTYWMLTEIPGYPVQVIIGLLFGFITAKYMRRSVMVWIWVLPLALFCVGTILLPNHDSSIISQVLRFKCKPGGPCFDPQGIELLGLTLVLVSSIAYSLGAMLAGNRKTQRSSNSEEQGA